MGARRGYHQTADNESRRAKDRELNRSSFVHSMPATCGGCGSRVWIVMSPPFRFTDDGSTPHVHHFTAASLETLRQAQEVMGL